MKLNQLLSLQKPISSTHDELMFIVTHQTSELWFKVILSNLEDVEKLMGTQNLVGATQLLYRVVEIEKVLIQQLHILETMLPSTFLEFREMLGNSSGFQSLQYKEIEFLAGLKDELFLSSIRSPEGYALLKKRFDSPSIWDAFCSLLFSKPIELNVQPPHDKLSISEREVNALIELFNFGKSPDLINLSEALISFDEYFWLWKCHHIALVQRMIGDKPGTGSDDTKRLDSSMSHGTAYLTSKMMKRFFPVLWKARTGFHNAK